MIKVIVLSLILAGMWAMAGYRYGETAGFAAGHQAALDEMETASTASYLKCVDDPCDEQWKIKNWVAGTAKDMKK